MKEKKYRWPVAQHRSDSDIPAGSDETWRFSQAGCAQVKLYGLCHRGKNVGLFYCQFLDKRLVEAFHIHYYAACARLGGRLQAYQSLAEVCVQLSGPP